MALNRLDLRFSRPWLLGMVPTYGLFRAEAVAACGEVQAILNRGSSICNKWNDPNLVLVFVLVPRGI